MPLQDIDQEWIEVAKALGDAGAENANAIMDALQEIMVLPACPCLCIVFPAVYAPEYSGV
jgi:hypothetical protein